MLNPIARKHRVTEFIHEKSSIKWTTDDSVSCTTLFIADVMQRKNSEIVHPDIYMPDGC